MHEAQQKLKPSEEQVLVNFLNESAERGFPQDLTQITNVANLIRQSRLGTACEKVGESWVGRFWIDIGRFFRRTGVSLLILSVHVR
jgi:hypothetical protein